MSLVTIIGTGPKIGLATAKKFAEEGFDVAIAARNEERLYRFSEIIKQEYGVEITPLVLDVKDLAAKEVVAEVAPKTDLVIYNVFKGGKSDLNDYKSIKESLGVGVLGAINILEPFIKSMVNQEKGKIFFTGGDLSHIPNPKYASISIDKAALNNYAMMLSQEYKNKGLQVGMLTVYGKVGQDGIDPNVAATEFFKMYNSDLYCWIEKEIRP